MLLFAALILALSLAIGSVLLLRDVKTKKLQARLAEATGQHQAAARHEGILNIRMETRQHGARTTRLLRLLKYDPAAEQLVDWRVVTLLAGSAGVLAGIYIRTYAGLPGAALACAGVAGLVARSLFGWQLARYRNKLYAQFPDAIGVITRAIRSGIPLGEGMRTVARECASPTREEFARTIDQLAIGRSMEEALWGLYRRTGLTEYSFFAIALSLQSQTGGSLAETLENLQDMVRKRVAMAKRGHALAAEARMSAIVLIVMPFVAAGGLSVLQPGYLDAFANTTQGHHMLMSAAMLMSVGVFVMRAMIRAALSP